MTRLVLTTLGLLGFSTNAFAQGFATDTINATPGFGSVIDSGPARFSSALIDNRMATLTDAATAEGCEAVAWAGTWVRGRSPRLQGSTDAAGTVQGTSITNASVDGVAFSASLASGGALAGATESGNALNGYFARLGSNRSIWYGVETDCSVSEPIDSLLAYYDFDGGLADQIGNAPAVTLNNGASLTTGGGGISGAPGDEALDLGTAGNSMFGAIGAGDHFDVLTTNNSVAVSYWQFSTATADTSSFWFISDNPAVPSHALQVHATWGDGFFYFDHSGCCAVPTTRLQFVPLNPLVGDWHHIYVHKDAGGGRHVWIDNVLQANVGGGAALPSYDGQVILGASGPAGTASFGGWIDDFAVFSEPLAFDQIAALAAGGSPLDL